VIGSGVIYMIVCEICGGLGFILRDGKISLCSCERNSQFKEFLLHKNFQLNSILPWKKVVSGNKGALDNALTSLADIFIKGEGGGNLFYSYMAEKLRINRSTVIYSSSDITDFFMTKNRGRLFDSHIGVVLGFDLTNSIQGKVMSDFLFFRKSRSNWTTTFWLPYNSMRRLETEYGDVFSTAFKKGTLTLLEVK